MKEFVGSYPIVARFSKILLQIQYPVTKKSAASKPCAARSFIPGGSRPVCLSRMMCCFQLSRSNTKALIIFQLPQRRFLKYGLDLASVPQLSSPVEITPGIITTGWWARKPWECRCSPTEKESKLAASFSCCYVHNTHQSPSTTIEHQ